MPHSYAKRTGLDVLNCRYVVESDPDLEVEAVVESDLDLVVEVDPDLGPRMEW